MIEGLKPPALIEVMYYRLISVFVYEITQSIFQGFTDTFLILAAPVLKRRKVRLSVGRKVNSSASA